MTAMTQSADTAEQSKKAIFISYSKADKVWRERVQAFLQTLETWADIEVWADDRIDAGADWYKDIQEAIGRSGTAVMLLTKDFLRTGFIAKQEVPDLLRRREEVGMKLIPLLIHDCPWHVPRWLRALNIVPDKATPLDIMNEQEQDSFLARMTEDISEFLETWEEPADGPTVVATEPTAEIDFSHLPETSATLFGRDRELDALDADWESNDTRVVALVAQGGEGKSALVKRWLKDLEADGWRGAERVFGWSFYSQGARDQGATAEMFFDTALRFFGDPDPKEGSAWDQGERLARLVTAQRTLLVLDGMEPLQSLHDFERGRLRDPGLQALLRALVRESAGLCVISTREPIPDLDGRDGYRAVDLSSITPQDGRALLRSLRVVGTDAELEDLATEFGPHALSVTLLGTWLYEQPGHAARAAEKSAPGPDPLARVLAGFEQLLSEGSALDLLRTQGLFDRPAHDTQVAAALDVDALDAAAIERLRDLRLLAPHRRHAPHIIEAHPLIREHYANELSKRFPDLFREAHRRIYKHLCEATKEGDEPTLEDLQPLYQAVRHGCLAGLQQETYVKVYSRRIMKGNEYHSVKRLGAFGSDLGAVVCFFEDPCRVLFPCIKESTQSMLLNNAASWLEALGRQAEALEPMRVSAEMDVKMGEWKGAAISYSNLSGLELTLGQIARAVKDAEQSVAYGDRSGDAFGRISKLVRLADTLHQAGRRGEAEARFREAEEMQAEHQPPYPLLYSVRGFIYCDLILAASERGAWLQMQQSAVSSQRSELYRVCREVEKRAKQTLEWAEQNREAWLLNAALDHVTMSRAALYRAVLEQLPPDASHSSIETAVNGLRHAGHQLYLPLGLLTRAWLRFLEDDPAGSAGDLDEAWEIAERGSMKLHMVDIYLSRARLFGSLKSEERRVKGKDEVGRMKDERAYPWESARKDLAAARALIEECGYWRRKEELEDAEKAAETWAPD